RHPLYDLPSADAVFTTSDHEFHVHSYFFIRESPYFRKLWKVVGSTAESRVAVGPYHVILNDVTTEEFTLLMWIFYNPHYSVYEATTREWTLILRLAQKWQFPEIEALCWREL
ncbi:hypothetical protein H4582DRAFT_1788723, partial [Lactarius indigo]